MDYTAKVQKVIIIPICSVYDVDGNLIKEDKMKPIAHYVANDLDVKDLAKRLEDTANERFYSKVKAPAAE